MTERTCEAVTQELLSRYGVDYANLLDLRAQVRNGDWATASDLIKVVRPQFEFIGAELSGFLEPALVDVVEALPHARLLEGDSESLLRRSRNMAIMLKDSLEANDPFWSCIVAYALSDTLERLGHHIEARVAPVEVSQSEPQSLGIV